MITKIMKWVSIAILLLAVFWPSSADYRLLLQFVVCAGALMVGWEAYRLEKHLWAVGFVAIAVLFNPMQPLLFSPGVFLWLGWLSVATFLASLVVLKPKPRFSLESLVTRPKGIDSQ